MKLLTLITLITLLYVAPVQAQVLNKYRWSNRVILVFTPTENNNQFKEQLEILKSEEDGMKERDLVVFHIVGEGGKKPEGSILNKQEVASLREQFEIEDNQFASILVGKDGTEKLLKYKAIDTLEFFSLIDTMPMRRAEVRRSRQSLK